MPTTHSSDIDQPIGRASTASLRAHESHELRLDALAEQAMASIESRLAADHDLDAAVRSVVRDVFGGCDITVGAAGQQHGAPNREEHIVELISDPDELSRIARVVGDILGRGPRRTSNRRT